MPCGDGLEHIFVRDKSDTYWKYVKEKGFRIVKLRFQQSFSEKLSIPKLASYNNCMRHFAVVSPHRTTLLKILASQRENLREIEDVQKI